MFVLYDLLFSCAFSFVILRDESKQFLIVLEFRTFLPQKICGQESFAVILIVSFHSDT